MEENNINNFLRGIAKDYDPMKHKENLTSFVLNGIYASHDGESYVLQNEGGNILCNELGGKTIIGHVNINRNEILLILKEAQIITIGILCKCDFNTLIVSSCFAFDGCFPIKGLARKSGGCRRTVYLYDGVNPDLSINLDDLDKYTQSFSQTVNGKEIIENYSVEEANEHDLWDCDKMKLDPDSRESCICSAEVVSGGNVEVGMWRFVAETLDEDFNSIGFSQMTEGVSIFPGDEWYDIQGKYNYDSGRNSEEIGGIRPIGKSIRLKICNIDTRYKYIRIYAIPSRTNDGVTAEAFGLGNLLSISSDTQYFNFSGINPNNGDTQEDVSKLTIGRATWTTSKVMEFVNKRLVRMNLKTQSPDWSMLQSYASKIETKYFIEEVDVSELDTNLGTGKNELTSYEMMGYMGDEVYELGIQYEHGEYGWSPTMHIPGRCNNSSGTSLTTVGEDICFTHTCYKIYNPEGIAYTYDVTLFIPYTFANQPDTVNYTGSSDQKEKAIYCGLSTPEVQSFSFLDNNGQVIDSIYLEHGLETNCVPGLPVTVNINDSNWQSENTSVPIGNNLGLMGYVECEDTCYSDEKDCEGNSIWGVDSCGNSIANTPIRHHRMPDRCKEPQYKDGKIRIIGIQFDAVEYPERVIGHRFVRGKKNQFNQTVQGSGYLFGSCKHEDEYVAHTFLVNEKNEYSEVISPDAAINKTTFNSDSLCLIHDVAIERYHKSGGTDNNGQGYYSNAADAFGGADLYIGVRAYRGSNPTCTGVTKVDIEKQALISPFSKTSGNVPIVNLTWDNKIYHVETNVPVDLDIQKTKYVKFKKDLSTSCNLEAIEYTYMHNCKFQSPNTTNRVFGGDTYINQLEHTRTLLTEIDRDKRRELWAALAIVVGAAISLVTGGIGSPILAGIIAAVGVTTVGIASIIENLKDGLYEDCLKARDGFDPSDGQFLFFGGDGYTLFEAEHICNLWTENRHNFDLVHSGTSEYAMKMSDFGDIKNSPQDTFHSYMKHKIVTYDEENNEEIARGFVLPETNLYNSDFSHVDYSTASPSFPLGYDYCDNCDGCYADTIAWSQVAFDEERQDPNRIFLANDKTTIGSHEGEITDAKFDRNRLDITTTQSLYSMSPNPRLLQTDAEQVYAGVGDFLSIPAQQLVKTNWGYAGNQGRFNSINTPYGWTWCDQEAGEVFNKTDRVNRISDAIIDGIPTMRHWFKENLPSCLLSQLPKDHKICSDSTITGIGLRSVYDPRFKRFILTKIDYEMLPGTSYSVEENQFYNNAGRLVELEDLDSFCNKSWTISFSYERQAWISWHSYRPTYSFNNHLNYYTTESTGIWKHDEHNHTTYYDQKHDFIIEYVVNDYKTRDLHSLHWYSRTKEYKSELKRWIDRRETFDRVHIYNSCQSTGIAELRLEKENDYYNNYSTQWNQTWYDVVRTERDYKMSHIRNIAHSPDILMSACSPDYIDCIPNPAAHNIDTSFYCEADLKDKYHYIRMFFKPEEDLKILFELSNSRTFFSIH